MIAPEKWATRPMCGAPGEQVKAVIDFAARSLDTVNS